MHNKLVKQYDIGKRSGTSRNSASSGDKKCLMLGEEIHRSGPLEEGELCVPLEFLQATSAAQACGDTFRLLCRWRRLSFDVCARREGVCSHWGGGSSCAREALEACWWEWELGDVLSRMLRCSAMAAPMAMLAAPPGPGKLTECHCACVGGICSELGDVATELNTELSSRVPGNVLDGLRTRPTSCGPTADTARVSRGDGLRCDEHLKRRPSSLIDMVVE